MNARILVLLLLAAGSGDAAAQSSTENERFCLGASDGENPSPQHCTFATLEACEAAKKSEAERCIPNPALTFPPAGDKLQLPPELRR